MYMARFVFSNQGTVQKLELGFILTLLQSVKGLYIFFSPRTNVIFKVAIYVIYKEDVLRKGNRESHWNIL